MKTSQKRAMLKHLSAESQKNIHEMLRLATEILDDHDYTDANGGQQKIMAEMEQKDFAHFGGDPSLSSMLRAYRANPDIKRWQEHRFNVRAMILLATPEKPKQDKAPPRNYKQERDVLEDRLKQKEEALQRMTAKASVSPLPPVTPSSARNATSQVPPAANAGTPTTHVVKSEIERLREENAELRRENKKLRDMVKRLRQVRTMLRRKLAEREPMAV